MSELPLLTGHCLCGAVRIKARAGTREFGVCHCGMCRRWSGGPMFALHCGPEVSFEGSEHVRAYASSEWAERGFCTRCGTHLYYRLRHDGQFILPLGVLDQDSDWVFAEQIFIDEKPPYYEFADETRKMTAAEVFAAFAAPPED